MRSSRRWTASALMEREDGLEQVLPEGSGEHMPRLLLWLRAVGSITREHMLHIDQRAPRRHPSTRPIQAPDRPLSVRSTRPSCLYKSVTTE